MDTNFIGGSTPIANTIQITPITLTFMVIK